jgi:hypothetical protein
LTWSIYKNNKPHVVSEIIILSLCHRSSPLQASVYDAGFRTVQTF